MSIPRPAKNIDGHCSAIVDNTLYVLSSNSFQSLPLKEHAQWSKEPLGVGVAGAACVKVGDDSDAYLFVVGGTTDDTSYSGLQKYSFNSKTWETIPITVPVLQGRTDHSVAYLPDSQTIVSYAGSQPNAPSELSSQTFSILTYEPYTINSYITYAPTANLPILQPFNTSHAVMVGGSDLNTQVWVFEPTMGFQYIGLDIPAPLPSGVQGSVIDGSDGSKVLEVYDMSVSPNNVSQIVLLGEYGQPAWTGQPVNYGYKRKRDLSLGNWPVYNDTNAPTTTRSDYSLAQGFRVSVMAGGSDSAPVAIFNQVENSWVDAADFFDSKVVKQQPLKPTTTSHTTHATTSTTPSASATTSAAAAPTDDGAHDRMLRTLGITLGVLCGIAAIFILVLIFLRWRKMKKRKAEGYLDEKENDNTRMSFADRGASFMKEAGGSINGLAPPNKNFNNSQNGSHSSLAIITGKWKRNTNGHNATASYDSTTRLVRDKNGAAIISEPVELVDLDEKKMAEQRRPSLVPRSEPKPPAAHYGPNLTAEDAKESADRRKRSSGWSKYFATSQPTEPNGVSHLPAAYGKTNTLSDASVYSGQPSQIPSSALVAPLDIDFSKTVDGQRLSHVASGSPAFNDSREDLAAQRGVGGFAAHEGQKGLIVDPNRPRSQSDTISSYNRSTMSSSRTTSEYYNETLPWTPTQGSFKDLINARPPSSVYDERERVRSRGKGSSGFFPGAGTSYRPKSAKGRTTGASTNDWSAMRNREDLQPPQMQKPAEDRDSTVTVFPTGLPNAYQPKAKESGHIAHQAQQPSRPWRDSEDRDSTLTQFPSVPTTTYPRKDVNKPPQGPTGGSALKQQQQAPRKPWPAEDRDSTLTAFPGVPSTYYPGQEQKKPVNSDLGWLNLGLNGSQTRL